MSANLQEWRERLNASGLPAFARTVREIASVARDADASAQDLSRVVSRDAAMTARLIHIANSSLFNLQGKPVETVSNAIVLLGFDAVRDLAVSVSVIDEMLKGDQHSQLGHLMAHGFHAAAHAKSFVSEAGAKGSEEVFVATLLKDIGPMAFFSRAGDEADVLCDAYGRSMTPAGAELEVLGFELRDLSAHLCRDWNLGELARKSHEQVHADEPGVARVHLGHELATVVEQEGFESDRTKALIGAIAERFNLDERTLFEIVRRNTEDAAKIAERFGILPIVAGSAPVETEDCGSGAAAEAVAQRAAEASISDQRAEQDPGLALHHLGLIAQALEAGSSRDELLDTLVGGACASLAGDLCYFGLTTPARDRLMVKYAAGCEGIAGKVLALQDAPLLAAALQERKVSALQVPVQPPCHQGGQALTAGIYLGGRPVGVLYMERQRQFDEAALSVFRQFAQQVTLILSQAA